MKTTESMIALLLIEAVFLALIWLIVWIRQRHKRKAMEQLIVEKERQAAERESQLIEEALAFHKAIVEQLEARRKTIHQS